MFEKFLNKQVKIQAWFGPVALATAMVTTYTGKITSVDDDFVCLDNEVYIVSKYIIAIRVK